MSDRLERLERLATLLERGMVSREEFDRLKAEILAEDPPRETTGGADTPAASVPAVPPADPEPATPDDSTAVSVREDAAPQKTPSFTYAKNPNSLTSFLVVMLWIVLGIEVFGVLSHFAEWSLLQSDFSHAEATANDNRQMCIAVVGGFVSLVTMVGLLMWVHRANQNCRSFGASDMRFTPGWCVGYYFIPLVNLVRPYQCMREIWQVSHDPVRWRSHGEHGLVGWWWGLSLLSGLLGGVYFQVSLRAETIADLQSANAMSILTSVIVIAYYMVMWKMIRTIAQKQEELVRSGAGSD